MVGLDAKLQSGRSHHHYWPISRKYFKNRTTDEGDPLNEIAYLVRGTLQCITQLPVFLLEGKDARRPLASLPLSQCQLQSLHTRRPMRNESSDKKRSAHPSARLSEQNILFGSA